MMNSADDSSCTNTNAARANRTQTENDHEYDIKDETLKDDIRNARKEAEEYVKAFIKDLKIETHNALEGAWDEVKPFIIIAIIWGVIGLIYLVAVSS